MWVTVRCAIGDTNPARGIRLRNTNQQWRHPWLGSVARGRIEPPHPRISSRCEGSQAPDPTTSGLRMNLPRVFAVLLLACAAGAGEAAERRYSIGVHDFAVPDADSHTCGISGGVSVEKRTETGRHLVGSVDLFVDHDKDDLDPDHIPIWWQIHLATDGDLWQAARTHVGWTADVNTRMNTVSSVERQIIALPAITARYDGNGQSCLGTTT